MASAILRLRHSLATKNYVPTCENCNVVRRNVYLYPEARRAGETRAVTSFRKQRANGPLSSAFLPYGRHCIDDGDVSAVAAVLRGRWLTTGPRSKRSSRRLRTRYRRGMRSSATAARRPASRAWPAPALVLGDAVVVPTLTFLSTANAVALRRGRGGLRRCRCDSGLMQPRHLSEALARAGSARLRAVLPVHLGGHIANMPALAKIAAEQKLLVIEDACHAVGGGYDRRNQRVAAGACSDSLAACFSFHPVKTIAMGEGGAVTTNDAELARRMRQLRSHGMERRAATFSEPGSRLQFRQAEPLVL